MYRVRYKKYYNIYIIIVVVITDKRATVLPIYVYYFGRRFCFLYCEQDARIILSNRIPHQLYIVELSSIPTEPNPYNLKFSLVCLPPNHRMTLVFYLD